MTISGPDQQSQSSSGSGSNSSSNQGSNGGGGDGGSGGSQSNRPQQGMRTQVIIMFIYYYYSILNCILLQIKVQAAQVTVNHTKPVQIAVVAVALIIIKADLMNIKVCINRMEAITVCINIL